MLLVYPALRYHGGILDMSTLHKLDILGFEREGQVFLVLAVYLAVQYRKSPSAEAFVARVFAWSELTILSTLFFSHRVTAVWYLVGLIVLFITCPQPLYEGPTRVVDMKSFEFDDLVCGPRAKDDDGYWLVQFYTNWAHDCKQFSPVFAQLSLRYGTERLRFARLNIGVYGKIAERYNLNVNPMKNKELPTLMLFQRGEPVPDCRLPPKNVSTGVVTPVVLHAANVAKYFELETRMLQSLQQKPQPSSSRRQRNKQ